MARTVLITGVSRHLGGAFARRLSAEEDVTRIIGVDVVPPRHGIGRAEFVRADIRSPLIARIVSDNEVDTVVHMGVIATPAASGGRVSQKEINVIGTMQLLAACQKAESLQRLVVKSTSAVYGSSPKDPAMFKEEFSARRLPSGGWGRDSVEVEGYVRGFARRRPDVGITMLRFANVIGPRIRTAMTDYFSLPLIPLPLGYDGRLQFVHEDDVGEALTTALLQDAVGTVNIAGDGIITATQAANLAGRPFLSIPHQGSGTIGGLLQRSGLVDSSPDQITLLTFGRGVDTTKMRAELGFEPRYTTREAFESFAARLTHRRFFLGGRKQPSWLAAHAAERAIAAIDLTGKKD
ncbi:NAD-dependent epimerase/dehydratase family protein [Marihabitans asiaticum]|uniref:UDP-glucose 4-epimerase n=1 Tax=Marihabitans asiaticum TaxID=415218 RepID=A0A560WD92_9MICO|nr:NAD-dependent epimerase/dehydratase family protein [Marihabitans asiaticum]TWD15641.1 UDP-glucose 4-epimerase [Marihabitans asiaticum]